jgi:hypothetical protein
MLQSVFDTCDRVAALSLLLEGITPLCQSQYNATTSTMLMGTLDAKMRSTRFITLELGDPGVFT